MDNQTWTRTMRLLIATLALVVLTASAQAQSGGGLGGGGGKHGRQAEKSEPQKPKIDDKAYNAALRNIPDKKYDAWHGVR